MQGHGDAAGARMRRAGWRAARRTSTTTRAPSTAKPARVPSSQPPDTHQPAMHCAASSTSTWFLLVTLFMRVAMARSNGSVGRSVRRICECECFAPVYQIRGSAVRGLTVAHASWRRKCCETVSVRWLNAFAARLTSAREPPVPIVSRRSAFCLVFSFAALTSLVSSRH